MGKRGPPPKPKAVKLREGTYQKCRDQVDSLTASMPAGAPAVPDGLDELAQKRWAAVVPELLAAGVLAKTDGGALEAYCRSFSRWSKLEEEAAKRPTVKTPFGLKMNPACAEARKLHREVVQPLELALGLHYAARSRVKAPDKPKEDPAEDFLFMGGPLKVVAGGKSALPPSLASTAGTAEAVAPTETAQD